MHLFFVAAFNGVVYCGGFHLNLKGQTAGFYDCVRKLCKLSADFIGNIRLTVAYIKKTH